MCNSSSTAIVTPVHSAANNLTQRDTAARPFVSVVIPCYNSQITIGECLASLEAQTYPSDRFEVIVADNGSTDHSRMIIETQFPRARLVSASQKGSGFARNAGIAVARGRFILSTDGDCVPDPGWMEALVAAMDEAPSDTAAIGGLIAPHSEQTLVERYRSTWVSQPDVSNPDNKVRYTATPNAIFDAARLRDAGGFDGTLGFDDTDLGLRLQSTGYTVRFSDKAVVRHRNPVTFSELYRHRRKYGQFMFALAQKHPGIFGDPHGAGQRRKLLRETVYRIAKGALKLPLSAMYRPKRNPFGWPAVDAVMAWANYRGYAQASKEAEESAKRNRQANQ
jgi:cellulose synthase/poly-beta-1,6-N-acetylglucosamine synthase-like glycosyltransferase